MTPTRTPRPPRKKLTSMERILIRRARIIGDLHAGPVLVGIVVDVEIRALVEPMVRRLRCRL